MKKAKILTSLSEAGIIAIIRTDNELEAKKIATACIAGGIHALEITYTLPEASDIIKLLKKEYTNHHVLIGAGTVLDAQTARLSILSGADFVVSPAFDLETAKLCNKYFIPYIPGCMTITEMLKASEAGCDIIKLFSSRAYPPEIIKDIKGPIPNIEIMPTGGINVSNIEKWIINGASVVGVGGQLTSGSSKEITETAKQFVHLVQTSKEKVSKGE